MKKIVKTRNFKHALKRRVLTVNFILVLQLFTLVLIAKTSKKIIQFRLGCNIFVLLRQIANLGLLVILIETTLDISILIVTSNLQRAIKEGKRIK